MRSLHLSSKLLARLPHRTTNHSLVVVTRPIGRTGLATAAAAMSASQQQTLDKSTPESKWREVLGTAEYRILREKGTEPPGSGEYNKHKEAGEYKCGGCGTALYTSDSKFDSGCGWPAFYKEIPGTVDRQVDNSMGMRRVEITCAKCGGHLGHVFEGEGFGNKQQNPDDTRHCVNSKSLKFASK